MSRRVVTIALTDDAWDFYSKWPRGKRSSRVCNSITMHEINNRRRKDLLAVQKETDRLIRQQNRRIKDLQSRLDAVVAGMPDPGENEWRL